eukprot:GDKJ01048512.1.p1 GENE.GDKJ01048512.1~~GDKJ01048512.1.p1  ORF type:complete len:533 (+),score=153.82 GDKJ01048512.1:1-1599(+)
MGKLVNMRFDVTPLHNNVEFVTAHLNGSAHHSECSQALKRFSDMCASSDADEAACQKFSDLLQNVVSLGDEVNKDSFDALCSSVTDTKLSAPTLTAGNPFCEEFERMGTLEFSLPITQTFALRFKAFGSLQSSATPALLVQNLVTNMLNALSASFDMPMDIPQNVQRSTMVFTNQIMGAHFADVHRSLVEPCSRRSAGVPFGGLDATTSQILGAYFIPRMSSPHFMNHFFNLYVTSKRAAEVLPYTDTNPYAIRDPPRWEVTTLPFRADQDFHNKLILNQARVVLKEIRDCAPSVSISEPIACAFGAPLNALPMPSPNRFCYRQLAINAHTFKVSVSPRSSFPSQLFEFPLNGKPVDLSERIMLQVLNGMTAAGGSTPMTLHPNMPFLFNRDLKVSMNFLSNIKSNYVDNCYARNMGAVSGDFDAISAVQYSIDQGAFQNKAYIQNHFHMMRLADDIVRAPNVQLSMPQRNSPWTWTVVRDAPLKRGMVSQALDQIKKCYQTGFDAVCIQSEDVLLNSSEELNAFEIVAEEQ